MVRFGVVFFGSAGIGAAFALIAALVGFLQLICGHLNYDLLMLDRYSNTLT